MEKRETILLVDDEEGVLNALQQQLTTRFGHECDIACARSANEALELLDDLQRDDEALAIVIADQLMPGMKGVELLEEIFKRSPETTSILLTGQAGLDAVVAGINRANLDYYISKPWDEVGLRLAVEGLLRNHRLTVENKSLVSDLSAKNQALIELNLDLERKVKERTRELADANSRLAKLAVTDGLTGLFNFRHFQERLVLECERSTRSGSPLSLLMIDVDHFKNYNDQNGHPAGDEVLRTLGRLVGERRRANDFSARYGGEEFVIVLVDTPKDVAMRVAERLRAKVEGHPFANKASQPSGLLTISVGVASFPGDGEGPIELTKSADRALYHAKNGGRNRVASAND